MTQEINRRLHEALGKCWHEPASNFRCYCHKCGKTIPRDGVTGNIIRPDYCTDPRLVIEAMMEKWIWDKFAGSLCERNKRQVGNYNISLDLIMDKTGKIAKLAIDWLEGRK